ncbi:endolytic transglycosylase MltG [Halobacillus trueperi]|uniref:Endolytic transglycosylase MltG n=1 Tax=Halobacillus trueperi TaxID=156205 RepID=A0A3E0JCP7_9BACI|nr:endolytic transglycosylase MltG [Halobacillus trueperi]REJ10587.1 hypothetical protein DYE48_03645 [Halobacillus trueperi]
MKQWTRSYALGLLTAVLVFAISYWNTNATSTTAVEKEYKTEELIEQLEREGYRTLTTDEWETLKENDNREASTPTPVEEPISTFSIDIVSGTTTDDISEKLLQANIIKDDAAFESFMKENDYSRYIQIGQATLNSEMSLQEIAEAITSK